LKHHYQFFNVLEFLHFDETIFFANPQNFALGSGIIPFKIQEYIRCCI